MLSARSRLDRQSEAGFSLIELLIVVAIILIIAAIAIPNLQRAKIAANQAAAVENIRTITSAAITYSTTYGNGYPPSLAALGGTAPASCNGSILLDEVLTTPPSKKSGYIYAYQPEGAQLPVAPPGCGAAGSIDYLASATPISLGTSGDNSYCSDQPGVIRFDPTGNTPATEAACEALAVFQ